MQMAVASRPYPSGGALYELEFYAAIAACNGLDRGLYRVFAWEPTRSETSRGEGNSEWPIPGDRRGRTAAVSVNLPINSV